MQWSMIYYLIDSSIRIHTPFWISIQYKARTLYKDTINVYASNIRLSGNLSTNQFIYSTYSFGTATDGLLLLLWIYIYIYMYTHTHKHTHICIYIYKSFVNDLLMILSHEKTLLRYSEVFPSLFYIECFFWIPRLWSRFKSSTILSISTRLYRVNKYIS